MLLAIDVGNTHLVAGLWDGAAWRAVWRKATGAEETEDQIASWLIPLFQHEGLELCADAMVVASVVPAMNFALRRLGEKWLGCSATFLQADPRLGIEVKYEPASAVGADRIANALGALSRHKPPIIVVDFGTATTFDAIDSTGAYVGGAILPGVEVSSAALVGRTAKLPQIELKEPERAVGRNTTESLQSGIVLGYAGAIDALAGRIRKELGGTPRVIATGGLGKSFTEICESIDEYDAHLTLDGLVIAHARLTSSAS